MVMTTKVARTSTTRGHGVHANEDILLHRKDAQNCKEEELQCDEELYKLAMEATSDGIWDWDVQAGEVFYSPAYFRMLGYESAAAFTSLSVWQGMIHPEDRDHVLAANQDCIEGRSENFRLEYRMLAKDGTWLWIMGRGKCVSRDSSGRALRLVGTNEDITERKELENRINTLLAEKELMLRDVHHRVKNNLSTIRSLLSLQAQSMRSKLAASALQVAAGRVQSMALLYDRLYLSGEYDHLSSLEFVPGLVDQILSNFPDYQNIIVLKDIDRMELPQKTVTGLSLIINELLTNAMKHAFRGRESGLIRICLRNGTEGFCLEIQDDGPGFSRPAKAPGGAAPEGFGYTLVQALVDQLRGTMDLDTCPGTRVRISVPLPAKAA
jgi:PAS domain S-box-containing protein